jgi:hypothetical protein
MTVHHQLNDLIARMLPVVQDFHRRGMFSPHAATIDAAGAVAGHALTTDGTTQLSVSQAIEHFERKFAAQGRLGEVCGTGIFYHSGGIDASRGQMSLPPATTTDECRNVVALLEHVSGDSVYLLIPYSGEPPKIQYEVGKLIDKPAAVFIHKPLREKKTWWKFW